MSITSQPYGPVFDEVIMPQFNVRLQAEYDANFLRDHLVARVYLGDVFTGAKATYAIQDETASDPGYRRYLAQTVGPDLIKRAINAYTQQYTEVLSSNGLLQVDVSQAKREIGELSQELSDLREWVGRIRWWQIRRRWRAWQSGRPEREGYSDHYPMEDEVR